MLSFDRCEIACAITSFNKGNNFDSKIILSVSLSSSCHTRYSRTPIAEVFNLFLMRQMSIES